MATARSRQWPFGLSASELARIAQAAMELGITEFAQMVIDTAYAVASGLIVDDLPAETGVNQPTKKRAMLQLVSSRDDFEHICDADHRQSH